MTLETKAVVAGITNIAHSFPSMPAKMVFRENLLDTIRRIFEQGIDAVFVEGESNVGKTVLLAQFCETFPLNTVCLFIRPVSRLAYDPSFLRFDICNQIHWLLHSVQLPEDAIVDDSYLPRLIFSLQRRINRTGKPCFFVIDGLDAIPPSDTHLREALIDLLPIGLAGFKWIFSGDADALLGERARRISCKSLPLPPFNAYETAEYLGDLVDDDNFIQEIHRTCKGIPGHLSSVRRIIVSGVSLQQLINDLPSHLSDLFEIEWARVNADDEHETLLLALLAFCRSATTRPQILQLLETDDRWLDQVVKRLGFIHENNETHDLEFVSDGFRHFATQKLASLREKAINLQLTVLLKDQYADDALAVLPIYLAELGRHEALLEYLQDDYFVRLLQRSGSLSPILEQNSIGLDTARRTMTDGDFFRLAIERSALLDLAHASTGASEIQALIALGEYDAATENATRARLAEDRLHLLAVIAKEQRNSGSTPEQALLDQIDSALQQVNPMTIGQERALAIASELISVRPEHAISLVEKAASTTDGENALDWALARLSIAAFHESESKSYSSTLQSIKSKITNRDLDPLFSAAKIFLESRTADDVIAEVKNLERAGDQIFLLRQWCQQHSTAHDAFVVLEYAFSLAIGTRDYVPNATTFFELCSALPHVADVDVARRLVGIVDGQRTTLQEKGPTEAFVRLQLTLARTEARYHPDAAMRRLLDLYFETVGALRNLPQRAACTAWFLAGLANTTLPDNFLRKENLPAVLKEDLEECIEKLFTETADQLYATKDVISALAVTHPEKALEIATSLNTLFRRDQAIHGLVASLIANDITEATIKYALNAASYIDDWRLFDDCIANIVQRCSRFAKSNKQELLCLHSLFQHALQIHGASLRCRAISLILESALDASANLSVAPLIPELEHRLWQSWEALDGYWKRVDVAFRVAAQLARVARETAVKFRDAAESLRSNHAVLTEREVDIRYHLFDMIIRTYRALVDAKLDSEEDFKRLEMTLNTEISDGEKALHWSRVIMALGLCGRVTHARELAFTHLRPPFDRVSKENPARRSEIMAAISPALWIGNRTLTLELVSELPQYLRDEAYETICSYLLLKVPQGEPYSEAPNVTIDAEYTDIVDVITLLERIESDYRISHFVRLIVEAVVVKRKGAKLTAEHVADIVSRLNRLIEAKLPSARYIQHDGYRLLCEAEVAQISGKHINVSAFVVRAEKIPNIPDQGFVLTKLAEMLPGRDHKLRINLLHKAQQRTADLPLLADQIDHYGSIAEAAWGIDTALSKKCMQDAFSLVNATSEDNDEEIASKRRRLVDLAYRFDKDLASSYASITDQDPARKRVQVQTKRRLKFNELKQTLADEEEGNIDHSADAKALYPRACWRLLGELNARRISALHIGRIRELVSVGAEMPLKTAFPIFSYALENLRITYAGTNQGRLFIRPAFEALVGTANFLNLISAEAAKIKSTRPIAEKPSAGGTSITVAPGEREKGIAYIKNWLQAGDIDSLVIADPYFGVDDLEVLLLIAGVNRGSSIRILTSEKHQIEQRLPKPWEDAYRAHWAKRVSDQPPPNTDIVVAGLETTGESPLHDRWWVAGRRAIRLGTSFNGLGNKLCEISMVLERDVEGISSQLDRYLVFREREHLGRRLRYTMFSL